MSSSEGRTLTVLAVDDSPVVQETIERALGSEYRVLVEDNALDALSLIYHEPVSVLLLDISMPEIDGLELCRTVRNLPQFQELPIIMLTARDKAFDKVKGRMAGATEYLTKPFDADQLRQVVGQYAYATLTEQFAQMMLLANSSGLLPLNETGLTGSTGLRARAVHCQQLIDLAQQTKPLTRALPYERSIWLVQGGGNVTTISAIECTDIALRASETLTVPTHQIMIDRPLGIWWSNR